jgi:hypothetical protein
MFDCVIAEVTWCARVPSQLLVRYCSSLPFRGLELLENRSEDCEFLNYGENLKLCIFYAGWLNTASRNHSILGRYKKVATAFFSLLGFRNLWFGNLRWLSMRLLGLAVYLSPWQRSLLTYRRILIMSGYHELHVTLTLDPLWWLPQLHLIWEWSKDAHAVLKKCSLSYCTTNEREVWQRHCRICGYTPAKGSFLPNQVLARVWKSLRLMKAFDDIRSVWYLHLHASFTHTLSAFGCGSACVGFRWLRTCSPCNVA